MSRDLARLKALDGRIAAAARPIRILSVLAWPKDARETFLAGWKRGNPALPQIEHPPVDHVEAFEELSSVEAELDPDDPAERYLKETARSYLLAIRMLASRGTRRFTRLSTRLYGRPSDIVPGAGIESREAAVHFVREADAFSSDLDISEESCCRSASEVAAYLSEHIPTVITEDVIEVRIDEGLAAKAAAGSRRVRLRAEAEFSPYDSEQLLQHEVFVHSLTALNGKRQPTLRSLGHGAPRTTATQEGLATFAELATGSTDLSRLKRIALRVLAIDKALDGADFLDIFRFFLEHGQSQTESFQSAMRIFRGGDVAGGGVFTKDAVYLHGLLKVFRFFQWALRSRRLDLGALLFAGRLTVGDVFGFDEIVEEGLLAPPTYLPPWYAKTSSLASLLAFTDFSARLDLKPLDVDEAKQTFQRDQLLDSSASIPVEMFRKA